jgi:Uma2 family endonuclease
MAARIRDSLLEDRIIAERRLSGADRYDEVWDGEYVMSPLANNEHQLLASRLSAIFHEVLGNRADVWSLAGANVSDQETDWTKNFRCPDVVVVLPGSRAQNRGTHWFGGPDLVVEIVSEGDASYEKFDFYGAIAVREAVIIDRDPWSLEIYATDNSGSMALAGRCDLEKGGFVASKVLDAELRLVLQRTRPAIEILHPASGRMWQA